MRKSIFIAIIVVIGLGVTLFMPISEEEPEKNQLNYSLGGENYSLEYKAMEGNEKVLNIKSQRKNDNYYYHIRSNRPIATEGYNSYTRFHNLSTKAYEKQISSLRDDEATIIKSSSSEGYIISKSNDTSTDKTEAETWRNLLSSMSYPKYKVDSTELSPQPRRLEIQSGLLNELQAIENTDGYVKVNKYNNPVEANLSYIMGTAGKTRLEYLYNKYIKNDFSRYKIKYKYKKPYDGKIKKPDWVPE